MAEWKLQNFKGKGSFEMVVGECKMVTCQVWQGISRMRLKKTHFI
jgi:hypothetical protein